MPEVFESLAREVVKSMGPIVPCPLTVTNAAGVVVAASPPTLLGET